MLDRQNTVCAGYTDGPLHYLPLQDQVLLLYPSAAATVILNAHSLALVRVLAFFEAFPSFKHTTERITCISVDVGLKLVVVAMNTRIAAWSLSGFTQDAWRIHSTLILPGNQPITTLDSKSGLLAVGTENELSVYTSVLEDDLPTWSKKWSIRCPTQSLLSFTPSLMYIASVQRDSNFVRIYSTTSGRQTQTIPHPRSVVNLCWRYSQASSRDDLILYTITSDSVLRIFLPVLDSPRTLQLHTCLDLFSSLPFSFASTYSGSTNVFWLDKEQIDTVFAQVLKNHSGTDDAQIRLIRDIVEEKWDLFLRALEDGSVVLGAVANIDRRPPTLLQQFVLQYAPPNTLPTDPSPRYIYVLPGPNPLKLTLITSPPLRTYVLSPIEFFSPSGPHFPRRSSLFPDISDGGQVTHTHGLAMITKGMNKVKYQEHEITRFVRTSEGHGVGVIRAGGCGEVWRMVGAGAERGNLVHEGSFERTDFVVVLDQGTSFATYSATDGLLTLYSKSHPPQTLPAPELESLFTYPTPNLNEIVEDNTEKEARFTTESIFGITPDFYIVHIRIETATGKLVLYSHDKLPPLAPLPSTSPLHLPPSPSASFRPRFTASHSNNTNGIANGNGTGNALKKILPVDPMAWGWDRERDSARTSIDGLAAMNKVSISGVRKGRGGWEEHDVLLSVSENGELAFWVPENGQNGHSKGTANVSGVNVNGANAGASAAGWRCTGRVRTDRRGFNRARCSSAKKTALVVPSPDGDELTVWDSMESEFASGLEYCGVFDEPIMDLDWNSTPDMQSILAVGFSHHVEILCQQRMTYFDEGPGWALCHRIDISGLTPYAISDSIWLSHGFFLVGSGHQMDLYGEPRRKRKRGEDNKVESESLFEYVARQNGPLEDYHPQMLLQCLLWGKVALVKEIIANLAKALKAQEKRGERSGEEVWRALPVERFLEHDAESRASKVVTPRKQHNLFFTNSDNHLDEPEGEEFSRPLITHLLEALETNPLPHLTPNEHAHLLVLIQATLEIDEQQRALDSNGLRYLISMRSFYILNQRATSPSSPPDSVTNGGAVPLRTGFRERLRYRDMVWAFHSESQELLLGACTAACNGKMTWADARALGVPVWLNSVESLRSQMEVVARNEYMAGENRDPVECSLFYFALGKSKLVHGLWRQAAWHKEQATMLKFLGNDFNESRWKTAALKNAYALLGKRRFEYAAAFFLLGGSLKDAVNVCVRQLSDFQLAVALARVMEQSNEGPVFQSILRDTVLPIAFETGNRWLGGWAFWLLHRRDLAVRILLTPLQDIAAVFGVFVEEIGEPHYDDPSLALLFSQLRSKTLQAVKGTSEISGRSEFNFVLQMARVFCRMGCHVLALDLVRSWSFERPSTALLHREITNDPSINIGDIKSSLLPSPTTSRRPMFPLEPALRRHSTIKIDMDILSLPPTRSTSPDRALDSERGKIPMPAADETTAKRENDLFARKAGLGSLMKSAKQDVQVPEFDMNAFV